MGYGSRQLLPSNKGIAKALPCREFFLSIAINHRPQRVWQQRVYCHAIKEAETTLTIKLQRPNPNEEEVGGLILEAMELTARRFCDEDI